MSSTSKHLRRLGSEAALHAFPTVANTSRAKRKTWQARDRAPRQSSGRWLEDPLRQSIAVSSLSQAMTTQARPSGADGRSTSMARQ
jgi:hypothetical protein